MCGRGITRHAGISSTPAGGGCGNVIALLQLLWLLWLLWLVLAAGGVRGGTRPLHGKALVEETRVARRVPARVEGPEDVAAQPPKHVQAVLPSQAQSRTGCSGWHFGQRASFAARAHLACASVAHARRRTRTPLPIRPFETLRGRAHPRGSLGHSASQQAARQPGYYTNLDYDRDRLVRRDVEARVQPRLVGAARRVAPAVDVQHHGQQALAAAAAIEATGAGRENVEGEAPLVHHVDAWVAVGLHARGAVPARVRVGR